MGGVIFKNPNKSEQPTKGVYCWCYAVNGKKIPLYIGETGKRHRPAKRPSTLARGASHLVRSSLSTDRDHRKLDTDFIVGTAIKYLTEKGYNCVWEHISDDPFQEKDLCAKRDPILQNGSVWIDKDFKLQRRDGAPWDNRDKRHVELAQRRLYEKFKGAFKV